MASTLYKLTKYAQVCIAGTAAFIAVRALFVISDVWLIWFGMRINNGTLGAEDAARQGERFDALSSQLTIGFYVVLVVSLILNGVWLYRASANAAQFYPDPARMSAGMAVGSYIIPIVSLFLPYRSMREIVNSTLGGARTLTTPLSGKFKIWWGCWVIGSIGGQVLFRMTDMQTTDDMIRIGQLDLVVHGLFIVAGVIFITILREISAAQDSRETINTAVFE